MHNDTDSLAAGLDTIAFWCLSAFVFAVPWEDAFAPLGGMLILRWLSFAVLGAAFLRVMILRRVRKPSVLHYPMAALAAWSAASLFWSTDFTSTAIRAGTYAQLLVLVWLIWELARTQRRVCALLFAYVSGTLISSASTIRNALTGRTAADVYIESLGVQYDTGQRYTAGAFNLNDLGLLLALSIPMSLYLLARSKSPAAKLFYLLQMIMAATAVMMTASRGATVSLAIGLAMAPLSFPFWTRGVRRAAPAAAAAAIVAAALAVPAPVWERLGGTPAELRQGTLSHRTTIWAAGLEIFTQHPIEGVGAAAFSQNVVSRVARPLVAHNTFLSVLVELGVIGALILAALLAALAYSAVKMPRLESRFWIVVLAAWTAGVCTGTWEYRKATWLLFGLAAAHAAASLGRSKSMRYEF